MCFWCEEGEGVWVDCGGGDLKGKSSFDLFGWFEN